MTPTRPPVATGAGQPVRRSSPRAAHGWTTPVLVAAAVGLGLAWGAATSGLQTVLPYPWGALANAAAPWVAAAFVIGTAARRPWTAATAGVLVCWGEVAGYYGVSALRGFGINPANVLLWAATGLVGGPVMGIAGWLWRRGTALRWEALGAALIGGAFIAEGATTYGYYLQYSREAVLFCTLGSLLAVGLGATATAGGGAAAARGRRVATTVAWLLPVVAAAACADALLHGLLL